MAAISTLKDGFEDGTLDVALWDTPVVTHGTFAVSGGALVGTGTTYSASANTVDSLATYDLTGDGCYVRFAVSGDVRGFFRLVDPSGDYYEVRLDVSNILRTSYNGSDFGGGGAFATREWWRIRESGGTIYWETADVAGDDPPASWTAFSSQTKNASFDATAVKVQFGTRCASGTTSFSFDGLNAATTYTPPAPTATVARGLYL